MTEPKTLTMALFDEPLALIKEQPHQLLISTMSIGLMAGFASSNGIIDPILGLVVAVGVEWAWLRGVSSDNKQPTGWGTALNLSAFVLAALWGTLWVAESLHAYDPASWGWGMAIIHVVPLVWLSLCSAMCHRLRGIAEQQVRAKAEETEANEARRIREAENDLRLEETKERTRLELWKDAQTFRANLAATNPTTKKTTVQPIATGTKVCQFCNQVVTYQTASEAGVIARRGCVDCRANRKANKRPSQ